MSLFLVYVEIGKVVPQTLPAGPLCAKPVVVRNKGRTGPPKNGFLMTDGLASDHLLQQGGHVAGRRGDELRGRLFAFVLDRLQKGARPHLAFIVVQGEIDAVTLPLDEHWRVPFGQLPSVLGHLKPLEVIEVVQELEADAH